MDISDSNLQKKGCVILSSFKIINKEFYAKYNNYEWEQVSAKEIGEYSWKEKYDGNGAFGVACVSARLSA